MILIVLIANYFAFPQADSLRIINYNIKTDKIIRSALTQNMGYELLKKLCEMDQRLSGSENYEKGIIWAKDKLESIGCDSVWLQPVMVPHWVRGNIEKAVIIESKIFKSRELNVVALDGSVGIKADGITANVIEVNDFDELKNRQDEIKNKIVFLVVL